MLPLVPLYSSYSGSCVWGRSAANECNLAPLISPLLILLFFCKNCWSQPPSHPAHTAQQRHTGAAPFTAQHPRYSIMEPAGVGRTIQQAVQKAVEAVSDAGRYQGGEAGQGRERGMAYMFGCPLMPAACSLLPHSARCDHEEPSFKWGTACSAPGAARCGEEGRMLRPGFGLHS